MDMNKTFDSDRLHYLQLLSQRFPTIQAAATEIIRLKTILNLPKATEHFMSDIHGEYEAFLHILNSCSGEVKVKNMADGTETPVKLDGLVDFMAGK